MYDAYVFRTNHLKAGVITYGVQLRTRIRQRISLNRRTHTSDDMHMQVIDVQRSAANAITMVRR